MERFLNVGCGIHFVDGKGWLNIDLNVRHPAVHSIDIFSFSASFAHRSKFDGIYLSHVIEHLTTGDARKLLAVCKSLLNVGGALRIVTPDFDSIVDHYKRNMTNRNYDLASAEKILLLEQCVRQRKSGTLRQELQRLSQRSSTFSEYALLRFGDFFGDKGSGEVIRAGSAANSLGIRTRLVWKLKKVIAKSLRLYLRFIFFITPKIYKPSILTTEPGERHMWVYSSFEIAKMAEETGYSEFRLESAGMSQKFTPEDLRLLELDGNGLIRKGNYSMFIELVT
jgi:hypothetical protein